MSDMVYVSALQKGDYVCDQWYNPGTVIGACDCGAMVKWDKPVTDDSNVSTCTVYAPWDSIRCLTDTEANP